VIRKYKTEDTDALISVWEKGNALAHPFLSEEFVAQVAKDMRNIYLPNAETWVLEEDQQPVGFIALIDNEIGGLFLDPSLIGKGYGRKMVDHAFALKGPLRVEVFKENAVGRTFYERYGFVFEEEYLHEPSGSVTLKMAMRSS
jgi:putative acetyltransferase